VTTSSGDGKGDWETCTASPRTSDKHNDPLPINAEDAAVTLEKRAAAMERWLLFSCAAAASSHTIFVSTACVTCMSVHHPWVFWIKAGWRAPVLQYVQLYTRHTRECWFKTAELPRQHGHKKYNITSPHQQPWAVPKQQQCQWRLPNNLAIIATITYKGPMEAWWNPQQLWKHTDIRNNKIKMIKQQFNGKFISFALILQQTSITTATAHIFVDNKRGFRKITCNLEGSGKKESWRNRCRSPSKYHLLSLHLWL